MCGRRLKVVFEENLVFFLKKKANQGTCFRVFHSHVRFNVCFQISFLFLALDDVDPFVIDVIKLCRSPSPATATDVLQVHIEKLTVSLVVVLMNEKRKQGITEEGHVPNSNTIGLGVRRRCSSPPTDICMTKNK